MGEPEALTTRAMAPGDWPEVERIYAAGIATGNATFETRTPSWDSWDTGHRPDLRFVAVRNQKVVGWVAAGPISGRPCYAGVVEHSVYVAPEEQGRGVGRVLMHTLIEAAERAGVWTIQTGIFPENQASVALHQQAGFRIVGRRERMARLHGVWRDVYLVERRS
ncbi:MAG: N-acetyltransferase [Candidatus Dormibacteraeota bacterium]|nr:N-acetyltransferase [Candidatus Dormibacteraeota bacterium]